MKNSVDTAFGFIYTLLTCVVCMMLTSCAITVSILIIKYIDYLITKYTNRLNYSKHKCNDPNVHTD